MSRHEDAVILPAPGTHTATVVWLHGLGADGNDFVSIVPELLRRAYSPRSSDAQAQHPAAPAPLAHANTVSPPGLPKAHGIKFVFPHAPVQPVTINNGMPMRAWYDILSLTRMEKQDVKGTQNSAARIASLLDAERAAGIPSEKLILAGFSQGCAMTLYTGLRYPHRLGGLLALSGYLPLHTTLAAEAAPANKDTPILMCHGQYDPVLPLVLGKSSAEILSAAGYPVDWREYPMQHQVCMEEIEDIGVFLRKQLSLG